MKQLLFFLFISFSTLLYSQNMDNNRLLEIITKQADTVSGISGNWQFVYKEIPMLCVTDATNNRMRIIAPIIQSENLDENLLLDSLTANFHSALDVKYAISNGILWSAYVHPLKELTDHQVESALSQVYLAAKTFGTTFSSTELIFGGRNNEEAPKEEIKEKKTYKF
ncbi:hypothetical protein [Aquimarina sp. 2201CG5-10]|uniref:hypothetical protein n=1 Tax=Aquimarina callyspongiae TaxID=3098150 RepID=UPI002AB4CE60|nr:hypothetical protein [Aquimarina sp. 2201CG5-10]MDY8136399.1 hypothetical protein [Aquimarina sp. 2201CG5-10]